MGTSVLLVEGDDDQHVMWNLSDIWEVSDIHVLRPGDKPGSDGPGRVSRVAGDEQGGGVERLLDSIPSRLIESDLDRLAVVVDADYAKYGHGPKSRWNAIRGQLAKEGYKDLPKSLEANGTVIPLPAVGGRKPIRFGVWIMPNNRSEGMLEDFVADMIPKEDEALSLVDPFLGSIPKKEWRFTDIHRTKARIHTWLAVSKQPGLRMGQAIKADSRLNANHPTVKPFLDWIQRVFVR